ncbi:MAG: AMP-binding protein [Candidatus Omnitrophica bacterium]|nr:AMP-binding protein [Candidatus Omnitrophota bacterium]
MQIPDNADAIIWNGRSFSWSLLTSYVHSTSRRLKEIGVKPGSRVLVEGIPAAGTMIIFLSLWHIGAIACPFDPRLTGPMAADIRRKIEPFLLLSATAPDPRFKGLRLFEINDVICVEPVEQFMAGILETQRLSVDQGNATIIFTSGSTGEPKAVLHSLKAHQFNAIGAATIIPFTAGDTWLMALPLYRISGIAVIFRALLGGGTMVFPQRSQMNADELSAAIVKYRPSHISLVPTQFLRLTQILNRVDWQCFKAILIGGAPIPERLISIAAELDLPVYLTYGMTETGSQIATSYYRDAREHGARVLPGREVCLIDHEICIRGEVLFSGYIDGQTINRSVDPEGWFHTGDIGVFNDGYLMITGRRDRMFISGGENIHPEMIEKVLLSLDGVVSARIEPKNDPDFGQVPIAYLNLKDGVNFSDKEIKLVLKGILLPYQVPKEIHINAGYYFPEK